MRSLLGVLCCGGGSTGSWGAYCGGFCGGLLVYDQSLGAHYSVTGFEISFAGDGVNFLSHLTFSV